MCLKNLNISYKYLYYSIVVLYIGFLTMDCEFITSIYDLECVRDYHSLLSMSFRNDANGIVSACE